LHVVPALPEAVDVDAGKQHINYVSIKPKEKGNTTFMTVLYPGAADSTPPTVSLERADNRATLTVTGENGGATLEFETLGPWRLTSANGQAVGELKPPTERTFKPLR
jgi:hypothetical protein